MRKRKPINFWKKHRQLWKKSGLNQQNYCKDAKISYHSFRSYSARFSQEENQTRKNTSSAFFLVPQKKISTRTVVTPVTGDVTPSTSLKLNLQKGMSLDIPDGFNPETLYSFFKVVNAL